MFERVGGGVMGSNVRGADLWRRLFAISGNRLIGSAQIRRGLAIVIALSAIQSGCALTGRGPRPVPPEQRAAYDVAMGNLPANVAAAEAGLEAFIARYPRSPLADDATEQLAQLALDDGRDEEGMRRLGEILSRYPHSDRAAPARLRLAQREYARDRPQAARVLLAPLDLDRLSLAEQRAALRLRIALAQTPVERMEQLSLLAAKLREEAEQRTPASQSRGRLDARRSAVDREVARLIASSAPAELEEMLKGLRSRPPS